MVPVTGTWSKKWAQGKFSNWAIKVRSFSGVGAGLGSGAAPLGCLCRIEGAL